MCRRCPWPFCRGVREGASEGALRREPTAANAWDAWDMVKCKDQSGFDMLCLRHVRWGTEIEFSITSTGGAVFVKPDAKHGTLELFADGSWEDFAPGVIEFECEFVFEWLRNNTGCANLCLLRLVCRPAPRADSLSVYWQVRMARGDGGRRWLHDGGARPLRPRGPSGEGRPGPAADERGVGPGH